MLTQLVSSGVNLNSRDKLSRTPLHLAAWAGHTTVVRLLLSLGCQINAAASDDMAAIHFAAQKGNVDVIRELLDSGVHVDVVDRKGMTALHFATLKGHVALARFLIERGSDPKKTNKRGQRALDLAKSKPDLLEAIEEASEVRRDMIRRGNARRKSTLNEEIGRQDITKVTEGSEGAGDIKGNNNSKNSFKARKGISDNNSSNDSSISNSIGPSLFKKRKASQSASSTLPIAVVKVADNMPSENLPHAQGSHNDHDNIKEKTEASFDVPIGPSMISDKKNVKEDQELSTSSEIEPPKKVILMGDDLPKAVKAALPVIMPAPEPVKRLSAKDVFGDDEDEIPFD
eukprot:CAMPEP_0175040600 /NCGR_PEP_ID=MMETSP0052_2-20121109/1369_1 /TAXON_ID=51329 ORGANISM="Polytomella parva, Strain SAG 63-3" /NCGR_SAMPLE_ID=MMETSP0052_2 /ASSEMBLY_ACC=CAM_ASM_000194 /LENGTH=342 /DNA_ID=CAMNT_0016302861 /DNA_START=124 /DNA_END=1152 /DNA_ORIENTATION=-